MPNCLARPGPYVTSIKGVTGHSLGAAGAIEAVSVVESMIRGIIPPTANTTAVDPELPPINVVLGQGQEWTPWSDDLKLVRLWWPQRQPGLRPGTALTQTITGASSLRCWPFLFSAEVNVEPLV